MMSLMLVTLCGLTMWTWTASGDYRDEADDQHLEFTWVPVPVKPVKSAPKDSKRGPSKTTSDRRGYEDSYGQNYASDHGGYEPETAASYAAPSGFDPGFGMVQNSVGFSALGFMGFLFFLKLIQDTLAMMNNGPLGRSSNMYFAKRAVSTFDDSWSGVMGFYVAFVNEDDDKCRRRMVCELRARLVKRYRKVGRVVSSVLSEILDPALRADSNRMTWLPSASRSCGMHSGHCPKKTDY